MFLEGASQPHINWALLGTGIRMAQDLGVHRKLMYTRKANAHDEQWKRAFWLVCFQVRHDVITTIYLYLQGLGAAGQDQLRVARKTQRNARRGVRHCCDTTVMS
jgi:hypothetical protein